GSRECARIRGPAMPRVAEFRRKPSPLPKAPSPPDGPFLPRSGLVGHFLLFCYPEKVAMQPVENLDTPSITIDLDRLEHNIARVQKEIARHGRANRPHIKTHKIPAIAKMQIDAGASGITCQKIGEAEAFVDAGIADDILITFNIIGDEKT